MGGGGGEMCACHTKLGLNDYINVGMIGHASSVVIRVLRGGGEGGMLSRKNIGILGPYAARNGWI